MKLNIVTLFPEFFTAPLGLSIPGRAANAGLVSYRVVNLRDFAEGHYKAVDDYPYGGGAGMVLKPGPFFAAVESLGTPENGSDADSAEPASTPPILTGREMDDAAGLPAQFPGGKIILMSARGRRFTHSDAVRLSLEDEITFLCGHYKDVDQRVVEGLDVEELSLGDFVLSGGEFAALAVVDAVVRLLPGAMSDHESASTDSFYDGSLSPPSYTRPAVFRGMPVPDVLLSGDHARVARWRREESERLTRERRPDLLVDESRGDGPEGQKGLS
ncbi:MAG: tRNA (guanosine(37)-N1)-methyltransferase TrmD [Gemmatimonadota bacterium]|jgi:tRNA (guanine37-N1)-methyltransferase|nr:tRNA (guanosine(37)-N1)-methyltransferase TrmD [Gemmatimonadota bacterium]